MTEAIISGIVLLVMLVSYALGVFVGMRMT